MTFTKNLFLALMCIKLFMVFLYRKFNEVIVICETYTEYYILKQGWVMMKMRKYFERQKGIVFVFIRNMFPKMTNVKVMLVSNDGSVFTTIVDTKRKNEEIIGNNDYEMILVEFQSENLILNKCKRDTVRVSSMDKVSDSYELSNAKFLGTQINVKEGNNVLESLQIDLSTDNFYVSKNILFDRIFVNYLLKQKLDSVLSDNQHYEVVFFDQNIQQHKVIEPEYIELKKDGFDIVNRDLTKQ